MSWGERSCRRPCRVPDQCTISSCNVNCPQYVWDEVTKPDSKPGTRELIRFPAETVKQYNRRLYKWLKKQAHRTEGGIM